MLVLPASGRSASPAKSPGRDSPDRRVCRKYRRAYIRKLKLREYRRLRAVVPALANKDRVTKVAVIEEAIKYIDELHQALAERVQTENDHPAVESVAAVTHQLFTQTQALHSSKHTPTAPVLGERRVPSPSSQWRNVQNGTQSGDSS